MIGRVFLGLQAIVFIPYGLYCLIAPESLADGAGVAAISTTGTIELQAMYGGLQVAIGVMCAVAVLRRGFDAVALYALLFVFAGLAVVRVSLGLMLGDLSAYTLFAMIYETACLLFLVWYLLLKNAAPLASGAQR